MDLKMKAEDITTSGVSWDCKVTQGIVPIISGEEEDLQNSIQAAFLVRGTVPQLPNAGVPWTDYLTQKIDFGTLDFYIRDSLQKTENGIFYPQYDIQDGQLTMKIGKLKQEA